MKILRKCLPVVAGLLSVAAIATTANATTALNIGGSSAARNFMGITPLGLCDQTPTPNYYITANNNFHTWTCTITTQGLSDTSVVIRYTATASADGILKLQVPTGDPASIMQFFDLGGTLGCTGPVVTTVGTKTYNAFTNCSNTNLTPLTGPAALPVHMGASDVGGSSFGQSGPLFTTPPTTQPQLDDSTLNVTQTAVLPFSIFVGKGVVKVDSGGNPAGPISGLTRLELEQILARGVTDWTRLGYGTVTDAAPTVVETTSPIVLCLRNAGSGTKATLDQTIMINTTETPGLAPNANVVFSSGTGGVLSCLAANRRSIGYMDSDQETHFLAGGDNVGLAYAVRVDGTLTHDVSKTDPREDLKCGRYSYWTNERLNRRTTSEGADIDALATAFITNASTSATIAALPGVGNYWLAPSDMFVSKNADLGPINWKTGAHPQCR
jgi:hypothetical protein